MPQAKRWWLSAARRYAERNRLEGKWSETAAANVVRCLRVWPARFAAAGLPVPLHARDVTAEMVLRWKANPMGPGDHSRRPGPLRQTTAFQALWILKGFLAEHRSPVARLQGVWRLKRGNATRRRWFDGRTVDRLYAVARSDAERLALALTAWAGLRRGEAVSLLVGDVNLAVDAATFVVARKGGLRQELPISRAVANALRPLVVGREPTTRVYPKGYSAFARDLARLGRRAGVGPVAAHDLRRTFGRVLYYERKVPIGAIRELYNHHSDGLTEYYIGASMDTLRAAVETFDRPRPPTVATLPGGP